MREYDWFRVSITESTNSSCSMEVTSFLESKGLSKVFLPPYDERQTEELLSRIESSLREGASIGHENLKKIGEQLYRSIFSAEVNEHFERCSKIAEQKSGGLRIEIAIDPLYLRRLPWELMHNGEDFLALSTATPIVRTIIRKDTTQFPKVQLPLGVLFIAASPVGSSVPINVGRKARTLCRGVSERVKEGRAYVRCYSAGKIKKQEFLDDLKSGKFHILHVSSHGVFAEEIEKGILEVEDEDGRPSFMSIEALGAMVKDRGIQLVLLDACQTAVGSVKTPLADLGYVFLSKGVAAAMGMQFSVPITSATTFCESFYSQLAREEPIEAALSDARRRTIDAIQSLDRIDWAIPVLYMQGTSILHVGGEPKPRRTHRSLPSLGIFIGREKQLNELTEHLLDSNTSIISIDGFGGIGKSTIVKKLASDIWPLFEDICLIDLRAKISYDKITEEINNMLIHHGIGLTADELKYAPDGRNERIVSAMERKSDGFLVVFDNFDTARDDSNICDLVERLADGRKTKVVVTARTPVRLVGRQCFFGLDKLDNDDAILLMRKLARAYSLENIERADKTVLERANARLDGHPQAIEIVMANLRSEPLDSTLERLPDVLARDIGPILEWSFNLLSSEEKESLLEVAVYEGEISFKALEAVHTETYPIPVKELVEKKLLTFDTGRQLYSLHPLIREFVYGKISRERRRKLHRMAARYFSSEHVKDPISAIHHMYAAEDWRSAISYTRKVLDSLFMHGLTIEAKNLSEQGLKAAQSIKDADNTSYFLHMLGRAHHMCGDYDEAEKLSKESLTIDQALGDKQGISATLHLLAMIQQSRGDYDEAEKLFKESLTMKQALGDKQGISATLHQIAIIQQNKGNSDEAEKLFKENLAIFKTLDDKRGISATLHQIAIIQQNKGDYDEAEKLFKESLTIDQALGDKQGISKTLHQIAIIQQNKGDYDEAEKLFKENLAIFKTLDDKQGISTTLHNLAVIQQDKGDYDEAEKLFKESLTMKQALGDKQGISTTLHNLAVIQQDKGNSDEAEKLFKENLAIFKTLDDKRGISITLHHLAIIQQDKGDYDEAEKLFKENLAIFKTLDDKRGISKTLHQIAIIQQNKGNYDEAEKLFKESLTMKQALGDKQGIALTSGQLGRLFENRGELIVSREYYEKALQIFRQLGSKQYIDLAERDLKRVTDLLSKRKD